MSIGDNLKMYRKTHGNMSQKDLATKLDISKSYMSELESGKRNPSIETVHKIADKLNISTLFLLEGKRTFTDFDNDTSDNVYDGAEYLRGFDNEVLESVIQHLKSYYENPTSFSEDEYYALFNLFSLIDQLREIKTLPEGNVLNFLTVTINNIRRRIDEQDFSELTTDNFSKLSKKFK